MTEFLQVTFRTLELCTLQSASAHTSGPHCIMCDCALSCMHRIPLQQEVVAWASSSPTRHCGYSWRTRRRFAAPQPLLPVVGRLVVRHAAPSLVPSMLASQPADHIQTNCSCSSRLPMGGRTKPQLKRGGWHARQTLALKVCKACHCAV
jgi:hypothetical protein